MKWIIKFIKTEGIDKEVNTFLIEKKNIMNEIIIIANIMRSLKDSCMILFMFKGELI